ncbi:MAG: NOG1 family protein [Candidatus Asgardarchaeia archaeon]
MSHLNPFRQIRPRPRAEALIDIAFRRSRKVSVSASSKVPLIIRARRLANSKLQTAFQVVIDRLLRIVKDYPSFDNISPFYFEIANILFSVDKIRKALGSISGAVVVLNKIKKQYSKKILSAREVSLVIKYRKAAFGRLASLLIELDSRLVFLEEVRRNLSRLPDADPRLFTVAIAGPPNVGKSTIVKKISSASPQIAEYPFTTRSIIVGHLEISKTEKIQIIDTPGLLDRPIEKRNKIELQAISALKYLANLIIFVLDPSETCGMPLEEQMNLYYDIKRTFPDLPVIPVANKVDITSEAKKLMLLEEFDDKIIFISAKMNEGLDKIKEVIVHIIKNRSIEGI